MKQGFLILTCLLVGGGVGSLVSHSFLQGQGPGAARPAAAIPRELTSYRDVVKQVLPAVVSIEAQARPGKGAARVLAPDVHHDGGDPFAMEPTRVAEDDTPARIDFGSGFLVSPKGVIVTSNHVVEGAEQVLVHLRDGRKFTSKDIKTDPKTDLAIIRIDAKVALPYLEFGDSEVMEIGDRILAVGAPFGLTGSVTHGIISGKGRALRMNMYEDFVQTDAAINPGNSGGPLINLEGKVVGINSAIKSRTGGFQGIGLAVSSNLGKTIVEQLLKDGVVRRGYLGVQIRDVDADDVAKLGLKEARGVILTRVVEETPGAKAGFKVGDVLLSLGNRPVRDGRELQTLVAGLPLGRPIDVEILRASKKVTLKVSVQEQPRTFGGGRLPEPRLPDKGVVLDRLGMEVVDLTPDLAGSLGFKGGTKGVVIIKVARDGLAAALGLRPGLLLIGVDRKAVSSLKEVRQALRAGSVEKGVLLRVQDVQGRTRQVLAQAD